MKYVISYDKCFMKPIVYVCNKMECGQFSTREMANQVTISIPHKKNIY